MGAAPDFPFVARSTAHLRPGHFWDIPLSNGRFGCGRVLFTSAGQGVASRFGVSPRRVFVGGVLDWSGSEVPTSAAIAGRPLLDWGQLGIVSLTDAGALIRGRRNLGDDGLLGLRCADAAFGGNLYEDGRFVEVLHGRHEQVKTLTTWGRAVMTRLAETAFGG